MGTSSSPANTDSPCSNSKSIETRLATFFGIIDGQSKSFDSIETAFEKLFHDNASHKIFGNRSNMQMIVRVLLSVGSKAEVLSVEYLSEDSIRLGVRIVAIGSAVDIQGHVRADIKDGKLFFVEPCEDAESAVCKLNEMAALSSNPLLA